MTDLPPETTPPAAVEILDCRGQQCPLPVIALGRRAATAAPEEVLGVAATDPAAAYDVPAWARMRRHEFLGQWPASDAVPVFYVRLGPGETD